MKFFAETPAALAAFCVELNTHLAPGTLLLLEGELGAGKTTLVRALVESLGGDPTVVHSPTFSLVHNYDSPSMPIIHSDFYRLNDKTGLEELGGLEFFADPALYCLEWPERAKGLLAQVANKKVIVKITLTHPGRSLELFLPKPD